MNARVFPWVRANAWTGTSALQGPGLDAEGNWGLEPRVFMPRRSTVKLLPAAAPDRSDWRHPKVGWGLVVPDDPNGQGKDLAIGTDLSPPLRKLLAARPGSPILRSSPTFMNGYLRRYFTDGREPLDVEIGARPTGIGDLEIPAYLLICASPDRISWRTQYALGMSRYVGRLDLAEDGLSNYVEHLLNDWAGADCDPLKPVVWSVDHGGGDITTLMQELIADALWSRMEADPSDDFVSGRRLRGEDARVDSLAGALTAGPGLIVTTSHGWTGTSAGPERLRADLGIPVDAKYALMTSAALPTTSVPSGSIWYAHACCSAGSDAISQCAGLFPQGHAVGDVLRAVSSMAGSTTSPLARRLLGAERPIRAFVGHVEPTFDWTLMDPFVSEGVSDCIADAFYDRLYTKGTPLGLALSGIHAQAGTFLTLYQHAMSAVDRNEPGAAAVAAYRQVAALDRQSLVLLGDPTVSLPLR